MTTAEVVDRVLAESKSVLLIDWPSRHVPDTLTRAGLMVTSNDGPDETNVYELASDEVVLRPVDGQPEHVDLVYTHRPIDELPEIADTAMSVGAQAVWFQSGRDETGAKDPRGCWLPHGDLERAREIVEAAGLTFISEHPGR